MDITPVTRNLRKSGLVLKKFSPQILTYAGIAGVVVAGVIAAKNTLKLENELDGLNADLAATKAKEAALEREPIEAEVRQFRNERIFAYSKASTRIAGLYVVPVALGAVSIGCIVGGHTILQRRNVALTAAYAALDKSFREYKDRVVKQLGLDGEAELLSKAEVETTVDENGVEHTTTKTVVTGKSPYAVIFDETCSEWMKESEYNRLYLKNMQDFANDMLHAHGSLLLNDVYDMLKLDRTPAGAIVGWVVNGSGDNFVDFDIYNPLNKAALGPSTSRADNVWHLDFNVDGVVYDLLGKVRK